MGCWRGLAYAAQDGWTRKLSISRGAELSGGGARTSSGYRLRCGRDTSRPALDAAHFPRRIRLLAPAAETPLCGLPTPSPRSAVAGRIARDRLRGLTARRAAAPDTPGRDAAASHSRGPVALFRQPSRRTWRSVRASVLRVPMAFRSVAVTLRAVGAPGTRIERHGLQTAPVPPLFTRVRAPRAGGNRAPRSAEGPVAEVDGHLTLVVSSTGEELAQSSTQHPESLE